MDCSVVIRFSGGGGNLQYFVLVVCVLPCRVNRENIATKVQIQGAIWQIQLYDNARGLNITNKLSRGKTRRWYKRVRVSIEKVKFIPNIVRSVHIINMKYYVNTLWEPI